MKKLALALRYSFPSQLLRTPTYGATTEVTGHTWSLTIEALLMGLSPITTVTRVTKTLTREKRAATPTTVPPIASDARLAQK